MLKKVIFIIYIIGAVYLALPTPDFNLKLQGLRSPDSGDNGGIPNIVSAYYTNQDRQTILNQVYQNFNFTTIFGIKIPLPTFVLEHPPEYAKQVIIDTHNSWHFREFIHPQRESLFVSFWEPQKRNQALNLKGPDYILKNNQLWQSKVTFYYITTHPIWRQLIWLLEIISLYLLVKYLTNTTPVLFRHFKKLPRFLINYDKT